MIETNELILTIISISATVAGISGMIVPYLFGQYKEHLKMLSSHQPKEYSIAQRDAAKSILILFSTLFSVIILGGNAIIGSMLIYTKVLPSNTIYGIMLTIFQIGMYSFLIPFIYVTRNDVKLIRLCIRRSQT